MAVFEYTAQDSSGNEFSGIYRDVENIKALRQQLAKMGYKLISVKREKEQRKNIRSRVKLTEVVSFAFEFAGMYSSGLSIVKCLETVESQTSNEALCQILADIRQKVESGSSLREAFEEYRDVFGDFYIGMIEAGETGGKLSETLTMAAEYLEHQNELRSRVKAAFAYPIIVTVLCVIIITALMIFVIPVFQKIYRQLHVPLPGPTLMLVAVSNFVRYYWWVIAGVIGAILFLYKKITRLGRVKAFLDDMKLKIPVFGKLNKLIIVTQYIRTFAMMLSAGVPIVESLGLAGQVVNNTRVNEITRQMQEKIITGGALTEAMSEQELFPPMIIQLAAAGEEAGVISAMLLKGVDYLDKQIDRRVRSLLNKLEPVLSVIMGLVVGSILMGVYLPMFDYMGKIK